MAVPRMTSVFDFKKQTLSQQPCVEGETGAAFLSPLVVYISITRGGIQETYKKGVDKKYV